MKKFESHINQNNQQPIKLKILIAEDDAGMEFLLSEIVGEHSRKLLIARNGAEAVKICQSNSDIDLILMDVRMPLMDGYEATAEIRKFNNSVIIIAQTSYVDSSETKKTIEVGCNECLSKPISNDILDEVIRKYFEEY